MDDRLTDGWSAYRCHAVTGVRARNPHPVGSEDAARWTTGWIEAAMADAVLMARKGVWTDG